MVRPGGAPLAAALNTLSLSTSTLGGGGGRPASMASDMVSVRPQARRAGLAAGGDAASRDDDGFFMA